MKNKAIGSEKDEIHSYKPFMRTIIFDLKFQSILDMNPILSGIQGKILLYF